MSGRSASVHVIFERSSLFSLLFVLACGVGLRVLIDWANHHGPSGDGWSLRGNGALVFAPIVPVIVVAAEAIAVIRKKWLDVALIPIALAAGMLAGGLFGV